MHQLETLSGGSATLTKVLYTGGEAVFTQGDLEEYQGLQERLTQVLKITTIHVAVLLREIHRRKFYLITNDKLSVSGEDEFSTPDTEKTAFEKWARKMGLGHSYSYLMKLVKVADLYDDHGDILDAMDEAPSRERLIWLAQRRGHPEMPRLLAASTGTALDWRATVKEVVEGAGEDEAQEEAEKEVRRISEKIREREALVPPPGRPRWESEKFRRWVRHQPCVLTGTLDHTKVDPAHIRPRGSGHDDYRNVVPLRNDLHRLSHEVGWDEALAGHSRDRDCCRSRPTGFSSAGSTRSEAKQRAEVSLRSVARLPGIELEETGDRSPSPRSRPRLVSALDRTPERSKQGF